MVYEGITVISRTERSQGINKEICRKRLASIWFDNQKPETVRINDQIKFGKASFQWWENDCKKEIEKLI
jgi:hypothetical protein